MKKEVELYAVAKAPAKAILLGEHFVVHGGSALAVALDRGVTAISYPSRGESKIYSEDTNTSSTIDQAEGFLSPVAASLRSFLSEEGIDGVSISLKSEVPANAGLGSSAASSVAALSSVARLFDVKLSKDKLYDYAMIAERMVHGRPSGIDVFVAIYGGLVYMKKSRKVIPSKHFSLVVTYSGIQRKTGEMIRRVSEYAEREKKSFRNLLKAIDSLVKDSAEALKEGEIGVLAGAMNFNHEALRIIGASNEVLDSMVRDARRLGFLGAKMTGAGGGGCIICLPGTDEVSKFEALRSLYPDSFLCSLPGEGVRSWKVQ